VVDDNSTVRRIGRSIIESFGFDCEEAENGAEALRLCLVHMPDVVLLDWNMPVMDGYAFLMALRTVPQGNHPVVIFCTTEHEIAKICKAVAGGAQEYIMKPFDAEMLRDKFIQTGLLDAA
jgi:two-component system chemotaxis response regulator CheY